MWSLSVGGSSYALVFVDRATRHNWVFGLKTLSPAGICATFNEFRGEAGRFAGSFCCDCDFKLIGSLVRSCIKEAGSGIVSSKVGEQSSTIVSAGEGQQRFNGLVESHWKTMVHVFRAYLTEKQMPQNFWFYSIRHAAQMMNHIPGRYNGKLVTPHMLVHGVKGGFRCWTPLFLVCYFHHQRDGKILRSKNQAQTLDDIVVGRSSTSNAIMVYNPRNKQFYNEVKSFRVDAHRLPSSVYSNIRYDGGLFCYLKRDGATDQDEAYPHGARVEQEHPVTHVPRKVTVMDISVDTSQPDEAKCYLVQFDDSTVLSVPLTNMW